MLVSTVPVSILGARFSIDVVPFWAPEQYLPVVGMLCGNAITGIFVSLDYILKELSEIGNSTEILPGTSLPETYRPLVAEALRRALVPTINQMSAMGIVTIPGMMMRAILDGTDVEQAARLQMIIMFMIYVSNALSCIVATHLVLMVCVDSERRICLDHIDARPHWLCRAFSSTIEAVIGIAGRTGIFAISCIKQLVRQERISNGGHADPASERTQLLT